MADLRLRKSERLTKRKAIQHVFAHGAFVRAFPLRVVYCLTRRQGPYPAQAAVTVPRRLYKRAADRNLLKRRLREAYRHHKHLLYDHVHDPGQQISLMIVYTSDEIQTFERIEKAMIKALHKVRDNIAT